MKIIPVPVLQDNYSYLVFADGSRRASVVDVAEVEPVLRAAEREGVEISGVLSTHHHFDHVGGNLELASRRDVQIFGNADDAERIPGLTNGVRDGDRFDVGGLEAVAIFVPAHTSGHLAYHFPDAGVVFTGDTLFAAGCGRLFEGKPAEMMRSLAKLASLPDESRVYCGHEYTVRNLEFATLLEPGNQAISEKLRWARAQRAAGQPTVPTTILSEKQTNPFLRVQSAELRASVREREPGVGEDDVAIFAGVRRLKDSF